MKDILLKEDLIKDRCEEIQGYINENTLTFEFDDKEEINQIIVDLKEILRNKDILGISGPQINYNKRIFCMKFKDSYRTFINPSIKDMSNLVLSRETCESIPNKEFLRFRANEITLDYITAQGKLETIKLLGKASFVFQHLMDHLDGILVSDIGLEIDKDFDNASEEEKDEVVSAYINALKEAEEKINNSISEDEELLKMKKAIDFTSKVREGKLLVSLDSLNEEEKEELKNKLENIKQEEVNE